MTVTREFLVTETATTEYSYTATDVASLIVNDVKRREKKLGQKQPNIDEADVDFDVGTVFNGATVGFSRKDVVDRT